MTVMFADAAVLNSSSVLRESIFDSESGTVFNSEFRLVKY